MTTSDLPTSLRHALEKLGKSLGSSGGLKPSRIDNELLPEENFAKRLAERLNLSPPVDVELIAGQLATVRVKRIPEDVDGLCLDINVPSRTPKIWLNANLRHHRRRFTLAHEIGHIIIPWHTGSIVDELDFDESESSAEYYRLEGAANRFAAELLMPHEWATGICQRAEHLQAAMHTIATVADVSLLAAALRVVQKGRSGFIVAAAKDGEVFWSGATKGTRARRPSRGSYVEDFDMPACDDPHILKYGSTQYFWWRVRDQSVAPGRPAAPWREILDDIVSTFPAKEQVKVKQSLNGITACAYRFLPKGSPVEVIFQRCLEALQNRSDYNPYVTRALEHPRAMEYVLARAYERSDVD